MMNWFTVTNNGTKEIVPNNLGRVVESQTETETEIDTETDTEIIHEMPEAILKEIWDFDKNTLVETDEPDRYFFYDLLDEIKEGIDLNHVETKQTASFLTKLHYTLEVLIVDKRIKMYGKDNGFSYTDQEYTDAYKRMMAIEFRNKYKLTFNIGFGLFIISSIGLLVDNSPFLLGIDQGIFFTSILLYGSLLSKSIFG